MAGQASPSLTSRLVCELKTKGEEEREHAFDKRLAVAKPKKPSFSFKGE